MPLNVCCCLPSEGKPPSPLERPKTRLQITEGDTVDGTGDFKVNNHLLHWEAWLKKRKALHKTLGEKLNREAGELLMNLGEENHRILEEKEVIDYTRINTYYDKYRGNPEFWTLPFGIRDRCSLSRDPVMFAKKKKPEMNQIPDIEYFGTPDLILDEKDILPRTRNLYKLWKNLNYRNQKFHMLWEKIQTIEPHKPDIESLIVIGNNLENIQLMEQQTSNDELLLGYLKVPSDHRYSDSSIRDSIQDQAVPSNTFMINGKAISGEDDLVNSCLRIRLFFSTIMDFAEPKVDYLIFENKGQNTIRFNWSKIDKFHSFRDILPTNRYDDSFFFNKNELVLTPSKTMKLRVVFAQKHPGTYNELWEITTKPKIWGEDFKLLVQLQGVVLKRNIEDEVNRIKAELMTLARNTAIKEFLNSIFVDCNYSVSPPKMLKFREKDMFESANMELFGPEKKSKYGYNQQLVKQLKQFFESVRQDGDENTWNYSVKVLERMAVRKDILSYVEYQTKQFGKAKLRRFELKRKYSETTYDEVETPVPETTDEANEPEESSYKKLKAILHQLVQPSVKKNKDREKYTAAFLIMRTYMLKISDALHILDQSNKSLDYDYYPCFNYRKVTTINDLPDRMIYERFDDIWIDRLKRVATEENPEFPVTEKPEKIRNIPPEDTKLLYSAYFHHPLATEGKGKGKGKGKDKEAGPKAKEKNKGKGDKSKTTVKSPSHSKIPIPIKEDFNPFKEKFSLQYEESTVRLESEMYLESYKEPRPAVPVEYNYDKYVAVYTLLSEAIDSMMCAVDSFHEESVAKEVLHELQACNVVSVPENLVQERKTSKVEDNKAMDDDEKAYYDFLLGAHLTDNKNTEDYLIKRKVNIEIKDETPSESVEIPNLFKPYTRFKEKVSESYDTYEDKEMQTSDIDLTKLKQIPNPFFTDLIKRVSIVYDKVDEKVEEEEDHEDFYIASDDDELTGSILTKDSIEEEVGIGSIEFEEEQDYEEELEYTGSIDIFDERYEL